MKQFGCTLIAENEVQLLHHQVEAINLPGMRFYHPPRDPDVTTFGDWLNRFGGQNKRKQSSRAVSNTKALYKYL